jgi:septal ring factor EnvC (AmiA/AmiB activator)
MPFPELQQSLTSIEGELSRLKTAVEHIDKAKSAAEAAIKSAHTTNEEFKRHLQAVTKTVDAILKPHQELIAATESLTSKIQAMDFPKQLRQLKMIAIVTCSIVLVGTVMILILCRN